MLPEDVNSAAHYTNTVLASNRDIGVVEIGVLVVSADAESERGPDLILDASAQNPGKFIHIPKLVSPAAFGDRTCDSCSTDEPVDECCQFRGPCGIEDRASKIAQNVRMPTGIKHIGGSDITRIDGDA
jgi:hypothetical protein